MDYCVQLSSKYILGLYRLYTNKSNPVFFPSEAACDKPNIDYGTVEPVDATIASNAPYTLTCDKGYKLGAAKTDIICTDGELTNPLPTCVAGLYFIFYFSFLSLFHYKKLVLFVNTAERSSKNIHIQLDPYSTLCSL